MVFDNIIEHKLSGLIIIFRRETFLTVTISCILNHEDGNEENHRGGGKKNKNVVQTSKIRKM